MKLSRKSKFLFDKFNDAIELLRKTEKKEKANKLKEEVDMLLNPRKAKFFELKKEKKRKKVFKFKHGVDPKIVAMRQNGQKGGMRTAAKYDLKTRQEWGSKAGNTTLSRYGKGFFKHIRSMRKKYPKKRRAKRKAA